MKIYQPTLLLDKHKCLKNIELMVIKSEKHKVQFRPHFKTHQSATIGDWYRKQGVSAITVSSVSMAKYFESNGWNDITIAYIVNPVQIDEINILAEKITLSLLVDSEYSASFLAERILFPCNVYIKIDTGYHRTGVMYQEDKQKSKLIELLSQNPKIQFKGFLTHTGHSYQARNKNEIVTVHQNALTVLRKLKQSFLSKYPDVQLSIGDTPSCSVVHNFDSVDEIRPGNFVFYDVMQMTIGACSFEQIAIAVACPVVAKYKQRSELVIYGGAVHLSKDYIAEKSGQRNYGLISEFDGKSWSAPFENTFISSLSQEHGIVTVSESVFDKINIGNIVAVLPVHACLTADLLRVYHTLDGEQFEMMAK